MGTPISDAAAGTVMMLNALIEQLRDGEPGAIDADFFAQLMAEMGALMRGLGQLEIVKK
jgi:hypothetical protein